MRFLLPLLLISCTSSRVAPIPDPLPPSGEWQSAVEGGTFLGLEVRENDSGSLEDLSFGDGVKVTRVVENSPARAAGLQVGDVVLTLNGAGLVDSESLQARLNESQAGEPLTLEVQRGDTVWQLSIAPTARVADQSAAPEVRYVIDPQRSRAGWRTASNGVQLAAGTDKSPFPKAGVPIGSVVSSLTGESVRSARELVQSLQAASAGQRIEVTYVAPESSEERSARVKLYAPPSKVTKASVPILFHYETDVNSEAAKFVFVDLWILSLFRYERQGSEREWSILSLFDFSSGRGELER